MISYFQSLIYHQCIHLPPQDLNTMSTNDSINTLCASICYIAFCCYLTVYLKSSFLISFCFISFSFSSLFPPVFPPPPPPHPFLSPSFTFFFHDTQWYGAQRTMWSDKYCTQIGSVQSKYITFCTLSPCISLWEICLFIYSPHLWMSYWISVVEFCDCFIYLGNCPFTLYIVFKRFLHWVSFC